MKGISRLLIALACGAIVTVYGAGPALACPTVTVPASFAATADGTGLDLSITSGTTSVLAAFIGDTHGDLSSVPQVAGKATGIDASLGGSTILSEIAKTSAPPNSDQIAQITSQTIGDPSTVGLSFDLARGHSTSTTTPAISASDAAELLGAVLSASPLVSVGPFAVRSTSNIVTTAASVTSEAHAATVELPIFVGTQIVSGLCQPLTSLLPPVGQACTSAVNKAGNATFVEVANIQILPADVQCALDRATNHASVPLAQAAVANVTLFPTAGTPQTISVTPGQTFDFGAGTPLSIHLVLGDTAVDTTNPSAVSATATALELDLLSAPLPTISIVASKASCTLNGKAGVTTVVSKCGPMPRTGAPLDAIYGGGALMIAAGLGLKRFLRRTA